MDERSGSAAADRHSFYDELRRRQRTGRLLSLLCLLIAGGIGVVLSSVVTPLLLLGSGGLLHGVAAIGLFPDIARAKAHTLGAWAALQSKHFDAFISSLDHVSGLGDLGVTIAPLMRLAPVALPALLAACLVWLALRHIAWRDEGRDMIARLHARPPDQRDLEERQLANIVAEMTIAAGLPAPELLLIDSPEINAAAVGRYGLKARVLITRGLLDQLDRDETSGVVAHLIASIGAGDIRLSQGILAVFQTFGFFVTFLDLPFRWSAWRALARNSQTG
jgi:Zn-dependent protease with chaperone function